MFNNHNILFLLGLLIYLYVLIYYPDYIYKDYIRIKKLSNIVHIENRITNKTINIVTNLIKNHILNHNKNIYLYINSLGGDFEEGYKLIKFIEKNKLDNITFMCIAKKAASTAFIIFQYCDKRYILKNSFLLDHDLQITLKLTGPIETIDDWYKNNFIFIKDINRKVREYISNKINMKYDEYLIKIKNKDWNIIGEYNILKYKLADKIVYLI
jgi:ATP-dependent protease ClpP protease subunit